MHIWFFIAMGIWIVTSLVRTLYEGLKFRKPELKENNKVFRVLMFAMFFMWASWVFMSFSDPVKFTSAAWSIYLGLALFVAGLVLFVLSETTK